jgi:hypothetical protein
MRSVIRKWTPVLTATIGGLFTLAGYLFPNTILSTSRDQLIEWAVVTSAFAIILGVFNVLRVHGQRILGSEDGWPYSLVLLAAASLSWVPPLISGASSSATQTMQDYVIAPLGGSLAALVLFTLTLSAVRLLRHRRDPYSLLFILVVALTLLGTTPLLGFERLSKVRDWLINVPGMAGVRGLLLGVALGTLITGARVLLGSDRPHSEF